MNRRSLSLAWLKLKRGSDIVKGKSPIKGLGWFVFLKLTAVQ